MTNAPLTEMSPPRKSQDPVYDRPEDDGFNVAGEVYELFQLARLGIAAADTCMSISEERRLSDMQTLLDQLAQRLHRLHEHASVLEVRAHRRQTEAAESPASDETGSAARMDTLPDTPAMKQFRRWLEAREGLSNEPSNAEEDHKPHYERMDRAEAALMNEPSLCAADFAAKAIVETTFGELMSDWSESALWAEAKNLLGMPAFNFNDKEMEAVERRLTQFGGWTGSTPAT
ncbi:MAG: hypothetical protein AAF871_03640 [Pseudomonadota bacterium]